MTGLPCITAGLISIRSFAFMARLSVRTASGILMDAYGVVLLPVVFALLRVSKPSRYFELGVQLRERTAGEAEKLQQLTSRISSCALRNIGRDPTTPSVYNTSSLHHFITSS